MNLQVSFGAAGERCSELILGTNIEVGEDVIGALLADRLRNSKFAPPSNHLTNMADCWSPFPQPVGRMHWKAEVTPGVGMSGDHAQLLSRHSGDRDIGCVQAGVWVRRNERLEAEIWAMAQGEPSTVQVGLRPSPSGAAAYDEQLIEISAPYWKRYTALLELPADDDEAEFVIRLKGFGAVWIDQAHLRPPGAALRADTIALIREFRPPLIRFPGGCLSTIYRWQRGIGPVPRRAPGTDPIWMGRLNYDFGTDEFLKLCMDLGATPQLSVALGSGTPQDAWEWAAYCAEWYRRRGVDAPTIYWQIGNEQWGAWEIGQTSAQEYARVLRDWVPGIRAAYPRARIIALGQGEGSLRNLDPADRVKDREWQATVLAEAHEHLDVLSHQLYAVVDGSWDRQPPGYLAQLRERARQLVGCIAASVAATRLHHPPKTIGLTEWNLWTSATQHGHYAEPADGAHVLFVATVLNGLLGLGPGLELANYYSLLNWFGAIQVHGGDAEMTAIAILLGWYREALPARSIALAFDDDAIDALCLEADARRHLFIVNWNSAQARRLELPGAVAAGEAHCLASAQPGTPAAPATLPGKRPELPAMSVSRIALG